MENSNQTGKSKGNIFFILVILLLVGAIGVLFTKYNKSVETIKSIEENLVEVNQEKKNLLTELDSLEAEIKLHMGKSAKLDSILTVKQAEIDQIRQTLEAQKADVGQLAKYKKQFAILKEQSEAFIKENAMLKHKVDSLDYVSTARKQKIDTMEVVDFQKTKQIENLSQKVHVGSQLRLNDVQVICYNKKDKAITRAKRGAKFYITGMMLKNPIAETGKKNVYARITAPSGVVFTANASNQFEFEGKTIMYSDKKEILYNNNDSRFEMTYPVTPESLEVGVYKVSLFCEGREIGKGQIELR